MDKQQAQKIIIQTFENPFDRDNFRLFLRNLLKSFQEKTFFYQGNYIPDAFKQYISSLERIGKYACDKKEIDLLIVRLKRATSLERARTIQRNFIAWYLKGSRGGKLKDAALVAFVSPDNEDWRFSLVKMDYRFEETPSGKIKVKEEFTPARRWSFLVGKNEKSHTAQSRFVPILKNDEWKPSLKDLEQAFNVEVVTREFFQKYRDLFIRTKLELDKIVEKDKNVQQEFQNKNINNVDFSKKLLSQITFLYFLQKKGWLGVERGKPWGTGPKNFIRRLFNKEFGGYQNFYNDILEPLFYEALRTDRTDADHYYSKFNCKLPFLNGGLFDPINNYNWVDIDILIPNELFSNTNRTKEGDIGDGILDVFDRYNFTVNEEEPLEKEVALDPELLGKVYEKLNAITPDNFDEYIKVLESGKKGEETKFNKEYGVYYTPREIVHYMCQESLKNYLTTELEDKVNKDDIETFIKYGEQFTENEAVALMKEQLIQEGKQKNSKYETKLPESIRKNAQLIDKLLADMKVCDPAVGSGAFPIGMMHEIVKLRQLLSIYLGKQVKAYDLKRQCIENSLYGVDIDPGAVEICKLRFWLSLIVDEEDFHNIKPLPNLDYKVVCGNSLFGVEKDLFNQEAFEKLEKLKPQYFNETNPTKKQQLKNEINKLICEITKGHKGFDFKVYFSEVCHQKGGFDIVIANPPYVRQERIKEQKPLLQKAGYEVYTSTSDLYTYFYEKSWKILKPGGFCCFISSNKWMRAKYGEKLRRFFKEKTKVMNLIDFCGYPVFEQTVDTNIILFKKETPDNTHKLEFVNVESDLKDKDLISFIEQSKQPIEQTKLDAKTWTLAEDKVLKLKEKIERIGKPLKYWDVNIYYGIKTGFNEAFIITKEKRDEILSNCKTKEERKRTEEIIKPILRGRDIGKYYYKWAGLWVIKIESGWTNKNRGKERPEEFFKKMYPAIYEHLISFKDFKGKGKGLLNRDDQGDYWWELRDCDYYPEFEKEKIVLAGVGTVLKTSIVHGGLYLIAPANFITSKYSHYLQALLNSKLVIWYYDLIKTKLGEAGGRFYIYDIFTLPLPPITSQNQHIAKELENLVDKILSITKDNDYLENPSKQAKVKEYEKQIDEMVYKLYKLTQEEIEIVKGKK